MIIASYCRHELLFKKQARTSRGSLENHVAFYIRLQNGERVGYGEAAPLKGLSIDDRPDIENKIQESIAYINEGLPPSALNLTEFPALQFAFETAQLSLASELSFSIGENTFRDGKPIKINGLIWMNSKEEMLAEAFDKAEQGYNCIKFKVGALDFDDECRMLEAFRKRYSAFKIDIRLDANGAFAPDEAIEKMTDLARFDIHSIEQPIRAGQVDWLSEICEKSPIAIALDEELIGVNCERDGARLLEAIRPQYIILKPTLLGGLAVSDNWIRYAHSQGIGWWATSALESNIGLNAIAQWCSTYSLKLPQGLGTGALYTNNITSPLCVSNGYLQYNKHNEWYLPPFVSTKQV